MSLLKSSKDNEISQIKSITCYPYQLAAKGPYPEDQPKLNNIRFTSKQIEAIRSGINKVISIYVCNFFPYNLFFIYPLGPHNDCWASRNGKN